MADDPTTSPVVLVTGAAGYLGSLTVRHLVENTGRRYCLIALDVRRRPDLEALPGVRWLQEDIRTPRLPALLRELSVQTVVHLAAVVTPGRRSNRELEYSIDVLGTRNLVEACVQAGVQKLIVTSSGAAYGYHPDNPAWLTEEHPLRGNPVFAYAYHKRLVEELLAQYRRSHPGLRQLIFRPGTILGDTTRNQITRIFERPIILGLRGSESPFVFIWDQDVVRCLELGVRDLHRVGIYNLAGDGVVTLRDIAALLGKPFVALPARWIATALKALRALRLTSYGPEQVLFLQYRPVLCNRRLKEKFGYTPQLNSRQVFERFARARGLLKATQSENLP